jgi:uncharacterized protein (UPF0276 family)
MNNNDKLTKLLKDNGKHWSYIGHYAYTMFDLLSKDNQEKMLTHIAEDIEQCKEKVRERSYI